MKVMNVKNCKELSLSEKASNGLSEKTKTDKGL
jgi:hypothetical protein